MNKNVKRMFFVLTLITLLATVGAVCAADDTNSTGVTDNSVSDVASVSDSTSDTIAAEPVATTSNKDVDTKTIEKEEKNLKITPKTIEVNNWAELQNAIKNTTQNTENDTYIINLNDGSYQAPNNVRFRVSNIIINGNGQTLEPKSDYVEMNIMGNDITFNDLMMDSIAINNEADLILNNIIFIEGGIENNKNIELNNVTLDYGAISNYEDCNLIIKNSTLNGEIYNEDGTVLIADDVIFGEEFTIGGGEIIINDTNRLTPYLSEFNGDYIIENTEINRYISNSGNLTLKNVTVNLIVGNSGNLILENCTMNAGINNDAGTITIADDVILSSNFYIARDVDEIISNLTNITLYIIQLNGDYVIENQVITQLHQNYGNLTIRNSTFNTSDLTNNGNLTIENLILNITITNNGNLTVKNTTLNSTISLNNYNQYGSTLIIADDVIIGEGFRINNGNTGSINNPPGTIIIDDYSRIFKYMNNFKYEAIVELGNYTKEINNYGNLTIENTTFSAQLSPDNLAVVTNQKLAKMVIRNSSTNTKNGFYNRGTMEFYNSTIDTLINNNGVLIISEDSIIGENFKITGNGELITNHPQLMIEYLDIWEANATLNNKTINSHKTNYATVTLNNCTINTTITNEGVLIIDDNTIFTENAKITGNGKIETDNITRILPFIDTINGNYEIKDTTLNKSYTFNGEVTLTNCTINSPNNTNLGKLTLNNCSIDVCEDNTFLTNFGTVNINDDTSIIGKIVNLTENGAYLINQETVRYFVNEKGLTSIVKPGDTLDIQGTIKLNQTLTIDKPVNIISTTKDAYIDLNTTASSMLGDAPGNCFIINKNGAYTNVTGIYFHNTQLWIYNTHHVTLDNISAVVENQIVGSGVGQTSIRANSSHVTLKNSFIYTENNGGSSSVVLAWANNCTIENNTIQGVGMVGNLVYLTTYNVDIPSGVIPNVDNKILNNIIIGPEQSSPICVGIMLSGANNTIGNNKIYYVGTGGDGQWDGQGYTSTQNNTFFNNTQKYGQPENELIIDTTNLTAGETTTIQASIYYTNKVQKDINKGKVTFKVNGKTLKDANGKVIYAKVVNGTATIENYEVPSDWTKEGTTIQAVYSGSTQCDKLTSEKTNITVAKAVPTLTTEDITATAGDKITLKATITDNDKVINTGKIVFKINGKTVKDENGKVIYAKVVNNTVEFEYTLPESYKTGMYNITATFISPDYNRLTDTKTLTVTN